MTTLLPKRLQAIRYINVISLTCLGIGLISGLMACTDNSPQVGAIPRTATVILPTAVPLTNPTPVSTKVQSKITPSPTPTPTPIPDDVLATVVDVIDGDTIAVVMPGDTFRETYIIRYLNIDAPPRDLSNPWGIVAYEKNRDLTQLKVVRLVRGQTELDEDGNLLRHVYLGNSLLNLFLVEQGLAEAAISQPDAEFVAEIRAAETEARANNLGLWGPNPTPTAARIRETNKQTNTTTIRPALNIATSIPRPTNTPTADPDN